MSGETRRPYRLGLDLGTNSLGWFMVWLEPEGKGWKPVGLGPGGVRIFPDGRDAKSGISNAADRRDARSARRRRDRFLQRQQKLMNALLRHGLMPADEDARKKLESRDPYELRAKALDEKLPVHHIGRALFHLNQRRGFQSNRKTDREENNEKGAIKTAADNLSQMMKSSKSRTLGELLWSKHQKRESVRARNTASGPKAAYDFYPQRDMLKDEFNEIWKAQIKHYPNLTDQARDELWNAIFWQRDLKEVPVGKCSLFPSKLPFDKDPDGYRISLAHPLAQKFRMLQQVRNLTINETGKPVRKLTKEQGDAILLALNQNNSYSFDKIRKLLKLPDEARFTHESERVKDLKGDATAERLSNKKLFHKAWRGYAIERQIEIVERLLNEDDSAVLVSWLQRECGVDKEVAERIADTPPVTGHSRFGLRALRKLVKVMEEEGLPYHDAVAFLGEHHSDKRTGEILDRLPYYGQWLENDVVGTGDPKDGKEKRFGRFPNPTVHIGLGQLRRVVNSLIDKHGAPEQIVIELARDLKVSDDKKKEIEATQAKNQKKNDERRTRLTEHGILNPSRDDLLKMRLWEELGTIARLCPFSGKPISFHDLMSDRVEIEHLIPYADCLDNKPRNLTVCFKQANRQKGKLTPYEAYGRDPAWPEILARANEFEPNKRWRFAPDARERLNRNGRDFLDRQLMETSWLAKVSKQYLEAICPEDVWVVTGQHTGLIRGKWGFNKLLGHNHIGKKDRSDHRHHAIDALVIALTDRSRLKQINSTHEGERFKIRVPLPWESLHHDLETALKTMVVSHKPEHGIEGQLHEETAYGFVADPKHEDDQNLVYRKALIGLTNNEIDRIRDIKLRATVRDFVDAETKQGTKLADALKKFKEQERSPAIKHGLRRVRLLKAKKPEYLLSLRQPGKNAPYKAYAADSNLFIEIFERSDGSWDGEAVTVFQANQGKIQLKWPTENDGARLLMRLYRDDLIQIEHDGAIKNARVVRLEPSQKRVRLAEHQQAGVSDNRHKDPDDPFEWIFGQFDRLKDWKAVPVRVDELGRVWRVSPPAR